MFADPALRVIPSPPREDLDAELATCWRLVHAAEYVELGERLPQLISSRSLQPEIRLAARSRCLPRFLEKITAWRRP